VTVPPVFTLAGEDHDGTLRRMHFTPSAGAHLAGDLARWLAARDPELAQALARDLAAHLAAVRPEPPSPLEPLTTR